MGMKILPVELKSPQGLDTAFSAIAAHRPDALQVFGDSENIDIVVAGSRNGSYTRQWPIALLWNFALMITLYSYPTLFGVADNNGYGLKVFAFIRLAGLPFLHEHIFDASAAPRGQLPYIVDNGETVGDSETIIAHLIGKYGLTIDAALGARERNLSLLVTRLLDDLYWVMSYSRWKDEQYWPGFRAALMREHASLTDEGLVKAREFNFQRYHCQGIGRYAPDAAYARGLADLGVLADLVPVNGYVHGVNPTSIDARIYGFIANIYFYDIQPPLKQFVSSRQNLVHHCVAIHERVMRC